MIIIIEKENKKKIQSKTYSPLAFFSGALLFSCDARLVAHLSNRAGTSRAKSFFTSFTKVLALPRKSFDTKRKKMRGFESMKNKKTNPKIKMKDMGFL